MSYVFDVGQGLPGRALLSGQPIWLCNAQSAESKVFSRLLVAKVSKDLSLIHRIKSLFLDFACPATDPAPVLGCEQLEMASPYNSSDGMEPNIPAEHPFMIGWKNSGASQCQIQSWRCMDDQHSLNSSDCVSQKSVGHHHAYVAPPCRGENGNENQTKLTTSCPVNDDLHYRKVLSALLKSSDQLALGPHFRNSNMISGFVGWKTDGLVTSRKEKDETPQMLLKKILFEVPRMHDKGLLQFTQDDAVGDSAWRPEANGICGNRVLLERRRREKINERFAVLKSLVPSNSKADKVSILGDTIDYLRDLEHRVKELESYRELTESESRPEKTLRGHVEQTSDNYGENNVTNGKKPSYLHKRKTCEDIGRVTSNDFSIDNLTVSMNNKDVLIEFRCRWRDGICKKMFKKPTLLMLFSDVDQQSCLLQCKGSSVAKPGTVRQALQRIQSSTFV